MAPGGVEPTLVVATVISSGPTHSITMIGRVIIFLTGVAACFLSYRLLRSHRDHTHNPMRDHLPQSERSDRGNRLITSTISRTYAASTYAASPALTL
jgi:hypothetical protein